MLRSVGARIRRTVPDERPPYRPPPNPNHLGSIPCTTSPRQHTPATPLKSTPDLFIAQDLNHLESALSRRNRASRPSCPPTPIPQHPRPVNLNPLESNSYATPRCIPFRMTSLRKYRGEGVNTNPFRPRKSPKIDHAIISLSLTRELSASGPFATLDPKQRDIPTTHCHPERSEVLCAIPSLLRDESASLSYRARTALMRNIPTRCSSICAFVVTRCFVTLALRREDKSPRSEGSPFSSSQSHTFLRRAINPYISP
jgi:hypothetical protein